MPTQYNHATELMVLQEFQKKIDQEEGIASFEKSESPDGIIHTKKGTVIGVEVTSAIRTDDTAEQPKDKNKAAIFLNKYGASDSKFPPESTLSESFIGDSYVQGLLSKITERIQEKEANKKYGNFKTRFNKSILVVYLDDLFIETHELEKITSQNTFSDLIRLFDEIYLYIPPTSHTSPSGINHMGGFYLIGSSSNSKA